MYSIPNRSTEVKHTQAGRHGRPAWVFFVAGRAIEEENE